MSKIKLVSSACALALLVLPATAFAGGKYKSYGNNVEIGLSVGSKADADLEKGGGKKFDPKDFFTRSIGGKKGGSGEEEHESEAEGWAKLWEFELKGKSTGSARAWYDSYAKTWSKDGGSHKGPGGPGGPNGPSSASISVEGPGGSGGHGGCGCGDNGTAAGASGGFSVSGTSN